MYRNGDKMSASPVECLMIWGPLMCIKTARPAKVVGPKAVIAFDFHCVGAHGAGRIPGEPCISNSKWRYLS